MFIITTALIIAIAVLLFIMIIIIHELGHFLAAKACGIRVDEFAIGMGPKIFSKQGKETLFTIRLIPIGGFCAMAEDEDSEDPRAFRNRKVWKRFITIAAGAVFNIILGLILMFCITVQEDRAYSSTIISHTRAVNSQDQLVDVKLEDTPFGGENGLKQGDKITSINGYKILCAQDFAIAFGLYVDDFKVDLEVIRDGQKLKLPTTTMNINDYSMVVEPIKKTAFTVLSQTALDTVSMVRSVYASLIQMFTGRFGFNDLSGPVGTASAIGTVATEGFKISFLTGLNNILFIMSLITINLGIFNLLPVPALDGGRLVFLAIEGIRRKPIKHEGIVHAIGFALLIGLIIIVTFNDISRLIKG